MYPDRVGTPSRDCAEAAVEKARSTAVNFQWAKLLSGFI
jgi:hypothetical protein